jgi:hypothetical protein
MSNFLVTATRVLTESCTISIEADNLEQSLVLAHEVFEHPSNLGEVMCDTAITHGKWVLDDFVGKKTLSSRKLEAIGAECIIHHHDESEGVEHKVYISFGAFTNGYQHDGFGVFDDYIYYYASEGEGELNSLISPAFASDFTVLSYELVYEWPTKTIYRNNGHAIPNDVGNYKVRIMRSASESCELYVHADNEESARELVHITPLKSQQLLLQNHSLLFK